MVCCSWITKGCSSLPNMVCYQLIICMVYTVKEISGTCNPCIVEIKSLNFHEVFCTMGKSYIMWSTTDVFFIGHLILNEDLDKVMRGRDLSLISLVSSGNTWSQQNKLVTPLLNPPLGHDFVPALPRRRGRRRRRRRRPQKAQQRAAAGPAGRVRLRLEQRREWREVPRLDKARPQFPIPDSEVCVFPLF